MLEEFKKFIMRGNVLDLAVAVIIGGAFGGIVTSLVNDILMPPIGLLLGNADFGDLYINLSGRRFASLADAQAAGAATVNYGLFLNTVINFLIVAAAIFLIVRMVNRFQPAPTAPPQTANTKECPFCISTIPLKATRCPNCTSELEAAPADGKPARASRPRKASQPQS
jgi:large conductance mechanosensitive channel